MFNTRRSRQHGAIESGNHVSKSADLHPSVFLRFIFADKSKTKPLSAMKLKSSFTFFLLSLCSCSSSKKAASTTDFSETFNHRAYINRLTAVNDSFTIDSEFKSDSITIIIPPDIKENPIHLTLHNVSARKTNSGNRQARTTAVITDSTTTLVSDRRRNETENHTSSAAATTRRILQWSAILLLIYLFYVHFRKN